MQIMSIESVCEELKKLFYTNNEGIRKFVHPFSKMYTILAFIPLC